jgi:hypothetical protein
MLLIPNFVLKRKVCMGGVGEGTGTVRDVTLR